MDVELLEELLLQKVRVLRAAGLGEAEALQRAGDELTRHAGDALGFMSAAERFCLRCLVAGAENRVAHALPAPTAASIQPMALAR